MKNPVIVATICIYVVITALPPLVAKLAGSDLKLGTLGEIHKLGPHFACAAMAVSFI